MTDQILYLAGVVAVAWLVTFALRSLPFVLFAGKDRELPPAVERVSRFISPVIIAGLIVYSYYGLYAASSFTPGGGLLGSVLQSAIAKENPYFDYSTCGVEITKDRGIILTNDKPYANGVFG